MNWHQEIRGTWSTPSTPLTGLCLEAEILMEEFDRTVCKKRDDKTGDAIPIFENERYLCNKHAKDVQKKIDSILHFQPAQKLEYKDIRRNLRRLSHSKKVNLLHQMQERGYKNVFSNSKNSNLTTRHKTPTLENV